MIKMVVMDLDGTLLLPDKTIDPINIETIKEVKEQGVVIVIATGREKSGIEFVTDSLDMKNGNNYVAGYNGGIIYSYKDNEYTVDDVFMEEDAHKVFAVAKKMGFVAIAVCGHVRYSYASPRVRLIHNLINFVLGKSGDYGLARTGWEFHNVKDINIHIPQAINKFVFIQTKGFFKRNRAKLERELSDYDVLAVGPHWYELMPKGVSKGSAVTMIAKKEGIQLDEVLVFGDAENDISMIQAVKYGYVMQNGMDSVKEVAYDICDSNENQGISKTIKKHMEGKV